MNLSPMTIGTFNSRALAIAWFPLRESDIFVYELHENYSKFFKKIYLEEICMGYALSFEIQFLLPVYGQGFR